MRLHPHDPFRAGQRAPAPPLAEEPAQGPTFLAAYVDRYPPGVNAGAEWMLHAMLRDLVRKGHRCVVATNAAEGYSFEGVEVVPRAAVHDLEPEVGLAHLLWTNEAIRWASPRGLPLLYIVHNDSQLRYWRMDATKVSGLIFNSEWIAAAHEGSQHAEGIASIVVRPPLVCADYAVAEPPPAEREFVTLVNPIPAKGSVLFYALADAEPGRRFLAVEGAYGHQKRPGKDQRNVEWQLQTPRMAADVLARTRVLLMPSHYESWGRAAVEAFAAGIPVIASPMPGLREALGDAGLFADHKDPTAWRAALACLDDPGFYAERSALALERAAELERIGRDDLDRFEGFVLRAAQTRRLSGMASHDPFRAKTEAAAPVAQLGSAAPPPAPASAVPSKAHDVVAWLAEAEGAEAERRAHAAAAAEAERSKPRKSVQEAVARIIG